MNARFFVAVVGIAFLAALAGYLVGQRLAPDALDANRRLESAEADRLPRDFLVLDAEGEPTRLGDYLGQPTLVNFWATWCAPCRREMPELSAVHAAQAPAAAVLGLALDRPAAVAAFLEELPVAYPVAVAPELEGMRLVRALGNGGGLLPFSVFVDGEGRVVERYLGELDAEQAAAGLARAADGRADAGD